MIGSHFKHKITKRSHHKSGGFGCSQTRKGEALTAIAQGNAL
jgi:hypothetical protein